jgi:hypothetical protein
LNLCRLFTAINQECHQQRDTHNQESNTDHYANDERNIVVILLALG